MHTFIKALHLQIDGVLDLETKSFTQGSWARESQHSIALQIVLDYILTYCKSHICTCRSPFFFFYLGATYLYILSCISFIIWSFSFRLCIYKQLQTFALKAKTRCPSEEIGYYTLDSLKRLSVTFAAERHANRYVCYWPVCFRSFPFSLCEVPKLWLCAVSLHTLNAYSQALHNSPPQWHWWETRT